MPHRRVFIPEGYKVVLVDDTTEDPDFIHPPSRLITVAESYFPPRREIETEDERIAMAEEWRYLVIVTAVGCLLYQPKTGRTFPKAVHPGSRTGIGYMNAKSIWMIENAPVAQYIYEQVHRVRLPTRHDLLYEDDDPSNLAIRNLRLTREANKKLFTLPGQRQYTKGTQP